MRTIQDSHLAGMRRELPTLFTVEAETDQSAIIRAKTPFALGLVVGFIMSRWTRYGISFNKMVIDTKQLTVKLQVLRNKDLNDMKVEWV